MSLRLAVRAPAKLNLHLEVLGRRPDGYHEVRTLMVSFDLADELVAEATDDALELVVRPAGAAPSGEDNLVFRAAAALRDATASRRGARLELSKRVPSGSGLGGASVDAAATLVLLERLWEVELDPARRHRIAASLGADVPFFLHGGLAYGFGRGDEIVPLADLSSHRVVVLVPPVAVSTAEAYGRLDPPPGWQRPDPRILAFAAGLTADPPWGSMRNDLEPAIADGWPSVAEALDRLHRLGSAERIGMTGSGGGVFALFTDAVEAHTAAESLTGGGRMHVGRTLRRDEARLRVRELAAAAPRPGG